MLWKLYDKQENLLPDSEGRYLGGPHLFIKLD